MARWVVVALGALLQACATVPLAIEATAVPEAEPPATNAESYALDPSTVSVEVDVHAMTNHTLAFEARGTLVVSPDHPLATSLDLDVDATSATASIGAVADVAKSSDFLSVAAYPAARFTSRALAKGDDGATVLYGSLTLHGTTRTLRVPVRVRVDGCRVDVSSEFALNRHDYHVDGTGSIDGMVGDTVRVRIHAHPPRAHAPSSCEASR